jgi:hypothetical protein
MQQQGVRRTLRTTVTHPSQRQPGLAGFHSGSPTGTLAVYRSTVTLARDRLGRLAGARCCRGTIVAGAVCCMLRHFLLLNGPATFRTAVGAGPASLGHDLRVPQEMALSNQFFLAALAVSCFHRQASTDTQHSLQSQSSKPRIAIRNWLELKSSDVADSQHQRIGVISNEQYDCRESTTFGGIHAEVHCATRTNAFSRGKLVHLRGGAADQVLPTAGPPGEDGKLRSCAQCGALETRVTLGHCKITQLYFCARTECRRQHWRANEAFWRERAAQVCQNGPGV